MGEVIYMPEAGNKQVLRELGSHRVFLVYDPDRPQELRWRWIVKVNITHELQGFSPNEHVAMRDALAAFNRFFPLEHQRVQHLI